MDKDFREEMRTLSTNLRQMKFMVRAGESDRLREEQRLQKMWESLFVPGACEKFIKVERCFNRLEGLNFGRMSFLGFNKEVERLMTKFEEERQGKIKKEHVEEKELGGTEMEGRYYPTRGSGGAKRAGRGRGNPQRGMPSEGQGQAKFQFLKPSY